jgi:hypothetical protein
LKLCECDLADLKPHSGHFVGLGLDVGLLEAELFATLLDLLNNPEYCWSIAPASVCNWATNAFASATVTGGVAAAGRWRESGTTPTEPPRPAPGGNPCSTEYLCLTKDGCSAVGFQCA